MAAARDRRLLMQSFFSAHRSVRDSAPDTPHCLGMLASLAACLGLAFTARSAAGQDAMGVPPPDAAAAVEAPKAVGEVPKFEAPTDGTTVSLSAGGQLATGNSRLLAGTANGAIESRWGKNSVGGSLLANYGRSGPPKQPVVTTTENVQGRVRYDRYLLDRFSLFLLNTGRHDRFQGIDFRYNLDPGAKYLFVKSDDSSLWLEAGYDLQYDNRREDARMVMGQTELLAKTALDHSSRLFVGFKHAFNQKVSFSTGLEYLQSFVHGSHNRLNYDALFAADLGAGLSLGFGVNVRYDHAPLPGKKNLDTATTVSLIYSYDGVMKPEEPKMAPCPEPPPPAASAAPSAAPAEPMPAAVPGTSDADTAPAAAAPAEGDGAAAPDAPQPSPPSTPTTPAAP
jgi:putative salt-induced outer membrane protein YdiY